MIVVVQLLIKYALINHFSIHNSLNGMGIFLLITATLFIASAGYIINDVYDVETDSINKPNKRIIGKTFSEKIAFVLFIIFNIIGVLLGLNISRQVGLPALSVVFIITSALLYVYSTHLKGLILVGNIVIALLVAISILIIGLFELIPTLNAFNYNLHKHVLKIIFNYTIFAFVVTFLREIVKDIEDVNGDYNVGHKTLPIAIGIKRTHYLVFILNTLFLCVVTYYAVAKFYKQTIALVYFLVLIIAPLIYIAIKLLDTKPKTNIYHISSMYKIVMFFGILSLLLYPTVL